MIRAHTVWKEKMKLTGEADGHSVDLDAKSPIGSSSGLTPKELVALGVCGCTAMDVVALLKKYKQPLESLDVSVDVITTEKVQPAVFKELGLTFILTGDLDQEKVLESVHLSQSKYCGVSAMIAETAPIHYKIILNGKEVGSGEAKFGKE